MALVCGGISAIVAMQHLYKIRRVVDFSTNKHGMPIDRSLPPFEQSLLMLGRHLHVKATLPIVMEEREFEQVRRRRFFRNLLPGRARKVKKPKIKLPES